MKEQINKVIEYLKTLDINGCITGSCLLPELFEGSDVDVFVYDKKSLDRLIYALIYNNNFQILDPIEQWKFKKYSTTEEKFQKFGVFSLKFLYNTCVTVNVVFKEKANNIFSVLSSFDIDVICKGFDIKSKQYLDLTNNSTETKIVSWNKWNTKFQTDEVWNIERILRQFERVIKYYKRGYNTDNVALKYIELVNFIEEYESIFNSENFEERLKEIKIRCSLLKQIIIKWLDIHEITEVELELIKKLSKEIN